jgi:small-conductance mechanosensitive channel
MISPASDILSIWARASLDDLLAAAALTLLAVGLHVLHLRFRSKGAAGVLALGKWLAALAAIHVGDERILKGSYETPVLFLYGFCLWMAIRALLHDFYADVYMTRIKHMPVNKILLNLLSFLVALILVGYGLRHILNVDVGSMLTSSAILTAMVGFSMQDTIGSLISGLLIQTEKPFKTGDWIKVGDIEGQVDEITWRYTKLNTFSSTQALIPNNVIAKECLVNLSEPIPQMSVVVTVPAPVGTPPVKVKTSLEDVLRKAPLVAETPEPRVRLVEIGLDQMSYQLVFCVRDFQDTVAARSEVLSGVWYEFKKQGIEFPVNRHMLVTRRKPACSAADNAVALMSGIKLFEGMRLEELELLAQCSAIRAYPPEARIVERGQTGVTMFIIIDGEVSVSLMGRELSRLGPGDVFGEMALLTGEPRQADVTALAPVSCLEVDREAFRGVLEKNPLLVANVTRVFKERESQNRDATRCEAADSAEGLFERFRRIFW